MYIATIRHQHSPRSPRGRRGKRTPEEALACRPGAAGRVLRTSRRGAPSTPREHLHRPMYQPHRTSGGYAGARIVRGRARVKAGQFPRCGVTPDVLVEPSGARTIPAGAGSTPWGSRVPSRQPDRPRKHGVDVVRQGTTTSLPGHPGERRVHGVGMHAVIPILGPSPQAGSTQGSSTPTFTSSDHHRRRGVHITAQEAGVLQTGPSPQARGPLTEGDAELGRNRTIPAGAGSTTSASWTVRPCDGPSPQARGPLHGRQHRTRPDGHPRTRGVHHRWLSSRTQADGPSPHARGPHRRRRVPGGRRRTIPARAGSTTPACRPSSAGPDHPRTRGVHAPAPDQVVLPPGPSPHARGPRLDGGVLAGAPGTIPARAGSTGDAPAVWNWDTGPSPHARGPHFLSWSFTGQGGCFRLVGSSGGPRESGRRSRQVASGLGLRCGRPIPVRWRRVR